MCMLIYAIINIIIILNVLDLMEKQRGRNKNKATHINNKTTILSRIWNLYSDF